MRERELSDTELNAAFHAYLADAPTDVRATEVVHRLATEHPVRAWLPGSWTLGLRPASVWIALVALLLLTLLTGLLVAGSWLHERAIVVVPPPPTGQLAAIGRWLIVPGAETVATDPHLVRAAGGRVLVVEGNGSSCLPRESTAGTTAAWIYDPVTAGFSPTEPLPEPLTGTWEFATLADGRVLAAGGVAEDKPLGHAWIWDPASGAWTAAASLHVPRVYPDLHTLPDGRVVALGGGVAVPPDEEVTGFIATSTVEAYDAAADRWSLLPDAPALGRIVVGPDGRLLSFAVGYDLSDAGEWALATPSDVVHAVTLWDPDDGVPMTLGMSQTRTDRDPALALPDGTVLTIDELGGARIFDPTNGWRPAVGLQIARSASTFTVLADGRVLVAGGVDPADTSGAGLDTAEVFDPRTGTSTLTRMPLPWVSPEGEVRLDDGSVLLIGVARVPDAENVVCTTHALRWVP